MGKQMKSPFEDLDSRRVLHVGQHPVDQATGGLEPIDYQIERLRTHLFWIEEHLATMESADPDSPQRSDELINASASCRRAKQHLDRLTELLFMGRKPSRMAAPTSDE